MERGAEDEVERPVHNLGISAVAAGLTMGLFVSELASLGVEARLVHRAGGVARDGRHRHKTSQVLVIVLLTYLVGIGHFAHSIAGSGEVLTAVLARQLPVTEYFTWALAAGNIVGGVGMVALFNYGQVHQD